MAAFLIENFKDVLMYKWYMLYILAMFGIAISYYLKNYVLEDKQ